MSTNAHARFNQLVQPRLDEGYRLARWLTGSSTDADDVIQEAAMRAWRAIEGYADGNARAWFLKIVRNTCYTWLQRQRPQALIFTDDLPTAIDAAPTPEAALALKDRAARLSQAIDALPVPLKEALVLREYHGLSYREIADIGAIPIGTVMSRLSRARQHLLDQFAAAPHDH